MQGRKNGNKRQDFSEKKRERICTVAKAHRLSSQLMVIPFFQSIFIDKFLE
jgi:hypothetical protein